MISASLFSARSLRALSARYLSWGIFLAMLLGAVPALADICKGWGCLDGACSDGTTPIGKDDCFFGLCGICDPNKGNDGWINPEAEVVYMPGIYSWSSGFVGYAVKLPVYRGYMEKGRCKWVAGIRFCARVALPRRMVKDVTKSGDPGNSTGDTDIKRGRPQLCAYEDPCDGMDPPNGNCVKDSDVSPYHKQTSNVDAMSIADGATKGAIFGSLATPVGAALGAAGGALYASITSTFNHVVVTNIGCIDMKIGPLPPTWSNAAWFHNSIPPPTFVEATGAEKAAGDPESIFESPRVKGKVCTGTVVSGGVTGTGIVSCSVQGSTVSPTLSFMLNPKPDADPAKNYKDCKLMNDGKKYCAEVATTAPDKVLVYSQDGAVKTTLSTFDRPGYMPKPIITEASGSTYDDVKMKVLLRGQTIVLEQPIDNSAGVTTNPGKQSAALHQVLFNIARPCANGHLITVTDTQGNTGQKCDLFDNMVCAMGYDRGPFTLVNKASDTPVQDAVAGTLNDLKPKDVAFVNDQANPEGGAKLSETFRQDLWVYSGSGGDLDTPAATGTQKLRPLSAYESGLCIFTPPNMCEYKYEVPGTYATVGSNTNAPFAVPVNCTRVTIKAWGAGSAGIWCQECSDWSGAAGGYIKATMDVEEGDYLNVVVGGGGDNMGNAGGKSEVTNSRTNTFVRAYGGGGSDGDTRTIGGSTDASTTGAAVLEQFNGEHGIGNASNGQTFDINNSNHRQAWNGGLAYGSTRQTASECYTFQLGNVGRAPFGGGGCMHDNKTTKNFWGIKKYIHGSYGMGGHGKVTISCSMGKETSAQAPPATPPACPQ